VHGVLACKLIARERASPGPSALRFAASTRAYRTILRVPSQEPIPPDLFLSGYSPEIRDLAERLRSVIHEAVPEAIERVRTGWRLIGYDVPAGRRMRYFAFVAPEPKHVHLGWQHGIWMTDPEGILRGAHLDLKKVRYVTYQPGDEIPTDALVRYTVEAAGLATLGPAGMRP
jgi:hypothetical protein